MAERWQTEPLIENYQMESCYMASEIAIIKIPAPIVTLQQFAELEGVSERTAYRWTTGDNPRVPIEPTHHP